MNDLITNVSNKCHKCSKPMCSKYCPLHMNIPMICNLCDNLDKAEDLDKAFDTLAYHNPFGYLTSKLCNHESQCYGNCIFKNVNFFDLEYSLSNKYFKKLITYEEPSKDLGICIIGGGIAGLTIAHFLLKAGIKVTIFEKNKLGGVITTAIPNFRFEKELFFKHISNIEKYANIVYKEITEDNIDILNDYHHIVLSIGAEIENHLFDNTNVLKAVDVLQKINNGQFFLNPCKVGVIGLGNTACDVARSLKKLNFDVEIIYRRDIDASPASKKEIKEVLEEGIKINSCLSPKTFENNILSLVRTELVDNGEARKSFVESNEYVNLNFDYLVTALGSKPNKNLIKKILKDKFDLYEKQSKQSKSLSIDVDNKHYHVCGDGFYGAWNIAEAINSGIEVVKRIYPTYLFGGSFDPITLAHTKIIDYLSKLGKVIIVPNGNKYNLKNLVSFDERVNMINIEISKLSFKDNIMISDFEKSSVYKGSIETLRYFNHPIMVIGDDCLKTLHTWINVEKLLSENNFLVISRKDDINILKEYIINHETLSKYKEHIEVVKILDENLRSVSSSDFRNNKNILNISDEVLEYIKNNKLYEV